MQLLLQGNVTNEKTALKYHDVSENVLQKVDDHKHRIQAINIMKKSQEAAKKLHSMDFDVNKNKKLTHEYQQEALLLPNKSSDLGLKMLFKIR